MSFKISRKSTRMDAQGRIFVHRDVVKAMGLVGGGPIEWLVNDDGQVTFSKVKAKKKAK